MFQFVHAADIHLDSSLKGLDRYEGAPVDEIRGATRRALENLVESAIQRKVAFVLIAGDLYDGDWRDYNTGLYFVRQVRKLHDAGILVYLISGNHDAENKMTKSLRLPENPNRTPVMLSSRSPETVALDDLGVVLHGRGFASARVVENVVDSYPARRDGWFNIGVLHTSLDSENEEEHARYAPCKLSDLVTKGYDYWALGHIHKRASRRDDPAVVFPGNLQGRHIRETGPKGAMLVTVSDDERPNCEFQPLDVFRWEECRVRAETIERPDDLLDVCSAEIRQTVGRHPGMPLAVRIVVTGKTPAHRRLVAEPAHWTNQLRAAALDVGGGNVWIEKVRLSTQPARGFDDAARGEGPIAELKRYIDELRQDEDELGKLAQDELGELRRKLPDDLKCGPDALALDELPRLREALDEIESLLVGRLHAGDGAR